MVTKIKFSGFRSIIKCPCTPPFCGYCEPLSSSFQPHRFPLKSPTGRGFSPFPFLPSAGRRVTAIQFYLLVHIDIFYYGCAFGARVQRVQKVQRVQRVAVAADAADYKKVARLRRGLCRRVVKGKVDGPPGRRLWPPDGGGLCIASLRGRRPFGPRGWIALRAMSFIMPPAAVTSA